MKNIEKIVCRAKKDKIPSSRTIMVRPLGLVSLFILMRLLLAFIPCSPRVAMLVRQIQHHNLFKKSPPLPFGVMAPLSTIGCEITALVST